MLEDFCGSSIEPSIKLGNRLIIHEMDRYRKSKMCHKSKGKVAQVGRGFYNFFSQGILVLVFICDVEFSVRCR